MSDLKTFVLVAGGVIGCVVILFTIVDITDRLKSPLWSNIVPFVFPAVIFGIIWYWLWVMGSGDKNAREIVARMMQTYAACASYQDEGVYNAAFSRDSGGIELKSRPFKTYFVRPCLFRLEWKETRAAVKGPLLRVIWCDGNNTFFYRQPEWLQREKGLGQGLHNTTSLAGGPSYLVPVMLLPEVSTFLFIHLKSLVVVGEERVQGVMCYHLSGRYAWFLGSREIWVGKEDYLLHKSELGMRMKNGYLKAEEIHSDIRINIGIPNPIFNFQPPSGLKALERR